MKIFEVKKEHFEFRHRGDDYTMTDFRADLKKANTLDPVTLFKTEDLSAAKAFFENEKPKMRTYFYSGYAIGNYVEIDYLSLEESDDDIMNLIDDYIEEIRSETDD